MTAFVLCCEVPIRPGCGDSPYDPGDAGNGFDSARSDSQALPHTGG
jgi:hypothetical protein